MRPCRSTIECNETVFLVPDMLFVALHQQIRVFKAIATLNMQHAFGAAVYPGYKLS